MDCARNIITANFSGGGTSATTAPLWQWDYGQVLCITGLDLPAAFEVHFSTNKTGGVSTTAVGADGQVTIPNVLLTIGKSLNAWIYLSDAQGEGETEYSILIPVKARPMPETYDAEVSGEFDDVVRQVSEYAETAQTAADNAGASASAAAASADSAAASASAAEAAKTAAETAQGKAEDAQAAAETAAQTATEKAQQTAQDAAQAAQSKADAESAAGRAEAAQTGAESAKTDAETAAQGAADSASAASASATSAGQAATSTTQSATSAAGSATTAQGAAQTAITKAGEASASADAAAASETAAQTAQQGAEAAETNAGQSASTATTKAAEAATSASNAAASESAAEAAATRAETAAATLTVDDALSSTSTNPVQNKVITGELTDVKSAINALKIVDMASGAIASFPDGAAMPVESLTVEMSPIQDLHGQDAPYPAGGGKNKINVPDVTATGGTYLYNGALALPAGTYTLSFTSLSGASTSASVSITDADGTAMVTGGHVIPYTFTLPNASTVVKIYVPGAGTYTNIQLEEGSTATAYAPYENLCPISGRESVTVERAGINVWDEEWEVGSINSDTGATETDSSRIRTKNFNLCAPGTAYYVKKGRSDLQIFFYDIDHTFISASAWGGNTTVTSPAGARYFKFKAAQSYGTTYSHDISINYPSTDHDYHPGDGQSVTIQLGQTVYGGTVDVTTGVMTVDTVFAQLTADKTYNTGGYAHSDARGTWAATILNISGMVGNLKQGGRYWSSVTRNDTAFNLTTETSFCKASTSPIFAIKDSDSGLDANSSTAEVNAAMNAWIHSNVPQIVYELRTPLAIQLSPTQLTTLKGQNNVWSDADSVTVEYVCDPKLYIDRLTEPDADMVADANITSGSYFMVGNSLYLATSNIASGAAIVPGVNCTRTNLAAALNAINA